MPAGPGLSAALHTLPLSEMPNDRMLELLRAQYRQLCHEQARVAAVLVELARCDGITTPGAVARLDRADPDAAHETRAALRWTRAAADSEHDLSESALHGMPEVFAAWLDGQIDRPRVRLFDQYLTGLTADQVAAVCAEAVPRAPGLTTGQLAALLRAGTRAARGRHTALLTPRDERHAWSACGLARPGTRVPARGRPRRS